MAGDQRRRRVADGGHLGRAVGGGTEEPGTDPRTAEPDPTEGIDVVDLFDYVLCLRKRS
ncbi:hypothetical protein [Micromonospora sp. DPT]|uniref:hypothetical protein n=1 Tax=Micromonospora sp. DPT TaxID=3142975 RepID=UPI0032084BF4